MQRFSLLLCHFFYPGKTPYEFLVGFFVPLVDLEQLAEVDVASSVVVCNAGFRGGLDFIFVLEQSLGGFVDFHLVVLQDGVVEFRQFLFIFVDQFLLPVESGYDWQMDFFVGKGLVSIESTVLIPQLRCEELDGFVQFPPVDGCT